VKDNKVAFPDGMRYRLLVLPNENAIDLSVLRKLETMVKEGLTIIAPRPVKATSLTGYPASDKEIKAIAARMWGPIDGVTITENKYGKGRVVFGKDVNAVLKELSVLSDFSFTSTQAGTALDYIHRTGKGMDIYFVVNRLGRKGINDFEFRYDPSLPDRREQVECAFRVKDMTPELWDPITGQIREITVWREENGRTFIPLYFEPEGSAFIVFRKKTPPAHVIALQKDGRSIFPGNEFKDNDKPMMEISRSETGVSSAVTVSGNYVLSWSDGKTSKVRCDQSNIVLPITGEWQIRFDTAWGGPARIRVDTLQSWTAFADTGVKYYAGTAVYSKNFHVNENYLNGAKVALDLGNALEMASITINGHKMAVRWCAPYRWDVTSYLHAGGNQLEVEVVNLWPNRLIGDSRLPPERRRTRTNIKKFDQADSEKYLRESGLLGPVTLQIYPVKAL
jgi:hypothetical protein